MRPHLLALTGPRRGERVPLDGGSITIGRAVHCRFALDDERVEPRHVRLVRQDDAVVVTGCNGSYVVNDQPRQPDEAQVLADGDALKVGRTWFVLREEEAGTIVPRLPALALRTREESPDLVTVARRSLSSVRTLVDKLAAAGSFYERWLRALATGLGADRASFELDRTDPIRIGPGAADVRPVDAWLDGARASRLVRRARGWTLVTPLRAHDRLVGQVVFERDRVVPVPPLELLDVLDDAVRATRDLLRQRIPVEAPPAPRPADRRMARARRRRRRLRGRA